MAKKLVLVESPAKAKTINKYLGKDFVVEATIGHIRNLPKTKIGIDVENNFQPQFVNIRGKGDVIKKIKSLSSKSSKIFIATDPDREGEAIAQDIAEVINPDNKSQVFRVLFNEITKNGVLKGINNPRDIDFSLVASQRARRAMDRLIGYKISPFLWKAIIEESGNSLSAGRVQSVALRLICEREVEIQKFIETEYWSILGFFMTENKETFKGKLFSIDSKEIKVPPKPNMSEDDWKEFYKKYTTIRNQSEANIILSDILTKNPIKISNIVKKTTKRNPLPPFITSTLQSESSKVFRLRAKQTMGIAQKLYEGIDLGKEGTVGLITYMRTDSVRISDEIIPDVRNFIKNTYGENYLPESPNSYEKKKGNVQDAHEAIRPTSLKYSPEFVKDYLDDNSFKLYSLIWKRFIASQMNQAILETTVVEVSVDKYLFKSYGQAVKFNGFMQVYVESTEVTDESDDKEELKNEVIPLGLEKNQFLELNELKQNQHFTKPLPRYTESTLIKELESKGIGRPSTYSMIVSTIVDRNYVEQKERKLFPTELGNKVNKVLVQYFPHIFDVGFTAKMEAELDQIAQGENDYLSVMKDFYFPFHEELEKVETSVEKILCDKCNSEMIIKIGRFGKFLACSNYPECKNIKSMKELNSSQPAEPDYTGETCEKCGGRTIFRKGKFGRFIGCEKYPECDFIKNISLNISCPKCKTGDIIERRTKKNRYFYGCSRYPDCDFISWSKPVNEECPECKNNYLEMKYTAKKGNHKKCPSCGFEPVGETVEQFDE
ncbi:MAG: type I DNA topoisomerase [Ignavibacteriaceae bacterium]|nr:type I DNA topoisomerase [Ignavibacteriaceae bacterium]